MGILQGRSMNAPLNENGLAQAAAFYDYYYHHHFDGLFHSELVRTKQTIQQFIDQGINTKIDSRIDEINWGDYEGRTPTDETKAYYHTTVNMWRSGALNHQPSGGESVMELSHRVSAFLLDMNKIEQKSTFLICSHGRTIKAMLCFLTRTPLTQMDYFNHKNTSLYIVENGAITLQCSTLHLDAAGVYCIE